MVNPSLRVQQVQLPDHFNDVNFMQIPRVDRCTTCHIAADRKGFEDAEDHDRLPHAPAAAPDGRQRVACIPRRPSAARPATAAATARRRSGRPATRPRRRRRKRRWEKKYDWEFDKFNEIADPPAEVRRGRLLPLPRRARRTSPTRRRSTPGCGSSRPSAAGAATGSRASRSSICRRSGPSLEKVAVEGLAATGRRAG